MINDEAAALMAKINKQYGPGAVLLASQMRLARRYPTGSLSLDVALGGGWPANSWTEVIGHESSGKTSLLLKSIAANQRDDPDFTVLWVAAEHFDTDWATRLGVDNERVIRHSTTAMEEAYEVMLAFAASRTVDAIVLDSYPALVPDDEAAKSIDETTVAIGARLTNKFFRKAGSATRRSHLEDERPIVGIFLNQWRSAIGAFSPNGTPKTTGGGAGKNYAAVARLEVSRAEYIDEARPGKGKARVGQVVKLRTLKNKTFPPHKVATFDFYFDDAPHLGFKAGDIDVVKEAITIGVLLDVIGRSGTGFLLGETRYRSRDLMVEALRENRALLDGLIKDIHTHSENP
jgi:recombination protein RecA